MGRKPTRDTRRLTALLVDDERPARSQMRALLRVHPEIEVVAEADSVESALAAARAECPNLVFLDVQMPRQSGFDFLAQWPAPCAIIFVTAHDEFAVRAFEVNALDYLLKPVEPKRLKQAIERLGRPRSRKQLQPADHIFTGSRFVPVAELMAIFANGPYSELSLSDGSRVLMMTPLKDWECRLPAPFARVHRSAIVNLSAVERTERQENYSYTLHLRGGAAVPMSRRAARLLRSSG